MAQKIKLKNSSTPSKVPLVADLELGEVAINSNDARVYIKKDVLGVESIVDITAIQPDVQLALNDKVDDAQVLTNVPVGALFTDTVYTHPVNHPASIITQDLNNRFVTDTEKTAWNSKTSIDDNVVSEVFTYSSAKAQQMYDAQATSIANLATAQAQIHHDDTTVVTTSNQVLSFAVSVPSTNTNIMTLDATADTMTFLSNASYSFLSTVNFSSSTGSERTITFEIYNIAGGAVLSTETVVLDTSSGQNVEGTTTTLLTVGKNGVPSAPLTVGIHVRASGTGYSITGFHSILASSSSYDVSTQASGISVIPIGGISSTNVQAALAELDTEMLHKDGIETITGVKTFSAQPVGITKASVGLGNVDNTSDATKRQTLVEKDSDTGAATMPAGTTAQRPVSPVNGYMRYNSDLLAMEAYTNGAWGSVGGGGGATGGGSDEVFIENEYVVTANYTIPAGKSAVTVGDASGNVTINSGVDVTLSSGSRWIIL
jgi:hypothetical protein